MRTARAQSVGQQLAPAARARDERALHRHAGERLDEALGDEALGHDVGGDAVLDAARRVVPGPIDATRAPASARASRPPARRRANSSPAALGLVTQTRSYGAGSSGGPGSVCIRTTGACTTLRAELAQAPRQPRWPARARA